MSDLSPVQRPRPVRELHLPAGVARPTLDPDAPEPAAPTGPPCGKCGKPMPPLPDDLAAMARANPGVVLSHEVCPGEERGPEGRYFEVRVQVVEVTTLTDPLDDDVEDIEVTELISFVAGHRANDLDSAMRPLALALGEKWQKAEKQAKVADS